MVLTTILLMKLTTPASPNLIPFLPIFLSQAETQRRSNVEGLDTGFLAGDFVA